MRCDNIGSLCYTSVCLTHTQTGSYAGRTKIGARLPMCQAKSFIRMKSCCGNVNKMPWCPVGKSLFKNKMLSENRALMDFIILSNEVRLNAQNMVLFLDTLYCTLALNERGFGFQPTKINSFCTTFLSHT